MNLYHTPISQRDRDFFSDYLRAVGNRYVYGRSAEADSIAEHLEVDYFIDDFTTETFHCGKPVVRLNDVPSDALIVSAVVQAYAVTVMKKLLERRLRAMDYFLFRKVSGLPLRDIPYWAGANDHFRDNKALYAQLYDTFADEESRRVFDSVLSFRLNHDLTAMHAFKANLKGMYFEPFLTVKTSGAVFFDVGAYDGYNSECFSNLYPEMASAVMFEPIPAQAAMLREKYVSDPRFQVHEYALSNEEGFVRFSLNNTSSKMVSDSDQGMEVAITRLDGFCKQTKLVPDFIKMDIEGAELLALEGAKDTIGFAMPNLAISVYHAASHMTDVFKFISTIHGDYKFYLRHYTEGYTETVLFAVPQR